ncbi:MAG: hypothetical protein H6P98_2594 [Candidatus Aminicenantes bacterium]|nr:hypothetical protein [Candidatus Aminicenantes bacterium]
MENNSSVRWGWLRAMYVYTVFGAGGFGLAMLLFPGTLLSALNFPAQDPVTLGLYGSVALASGLVAILALRSPLKFVPLLLLQLIYKPIWLAFFAIPLFIKGQFPLYVVFISAVFVTYIIGDLIAIPFSYLFSKK